jgi:RNA-binding protein YhbY
MKKVIFTQIGKKGVTENFIETLKEFFKKNKTVRISVLRSARENGKADVKNYAKEIEEKLGRNYKTRIIGFVIIIKKFALRSV